MDQIKHQNFVFEPKIDGWRVAQLYRVVADGILAEVRSAPRPERAKVMGELLNMPPSDLYERVYPRIPENLRDSYDSGSNGAVFDTIQQFAKLRSPDDGRMHPVSALKCLKTATRLLENSLRLPWHASIPLAPILATTQEILKLHNRVLENGSWSRFMRSW